MVEEPENRFHLSWRPHDSFPADGDTCDVFKPTHLRSPVRLISFGHMIRDQGVALALLPKRLGVDPMAYQWVRTPTSVPGDLDPTTYEHYKGWFGGIESLTWAQMLANCDTGARCAPALCSASTVSHHHASRSLLSL